MTVVEYDGRIVVVDCGLMFPTTEMLGIDLVLPDFAYLRERADRIEAIVLTHGHEDHVGALPWVLRELATRQAAARLRRRRSRSRSRARRSRSTSSNDVPMHEIDPGEAVAGGAVRARADPRLALDSRRLRGRDHRATSARC